jgi:hypothetical protein
MDEMLIILIKWMHTSYRFTTVVNILDIEGIKTVIFFGGGRSGGKEGERERWREREMERERWRERERER